MQLCGLVLLRPENNYDVEKLFELNVLKTAWTIVELACTIVRVEHKVAYQRPLTYLS